MTSAQNSSQALPASHTGFHFDPWVCWRRKWHLVASMTVIMSAGVVYLIVAKPVYEAGARVLIQKEGLTFNREHPFAQDRFFLATQAEVIGSPLTVRRALESVTVTIPPKLKDKVAPVDFVLASLRVTPVIDTNVLRIDYRSQHPEEAVQLVQACIKSYRENLEDSEGDTYSDTLRLLVQQESELRDELQSLQVEYEELRHGGPLVGRAADGTDVHTALLRELGQRLTEARIRRINIETRVQNLAQSRMHDHFTRSNHNEGSNKHDTAGESPGIDGASGEAAAVRNRVANDIIRFAAVETSGDDRAAREPLPTDLTEMLLEQTTPAYQEIATIRNELWRAKAEAQSLRAQRIGPKHPAYRAAQAQISWWNNLLEQRRKDLGSPVDQLAVARSEEVKLNRLYEEEHERVKSMDNFQIREQMLLGNIRRVEEVHNNALSRLKEFELVDQAADDGRVSVTVKMLNGPNLLAKLIWPRKAQFLALCAGIGLCGGLSLVFLMDNIQRRAAPAAT